MRPVTPRMSGAAPRSPMATATGTRHTPGSRQYRNNQPRIAVFDNLSLPAQAPATESHRDLGTDPTGKFSSRMQGDTHASHPCDYGCSVQSGEESPQLEGGCPEVSCLRPLPPGRTTQMWL